MKNLFMIAMALITINATAQDRKKDAQQGHMKQRMEMRTKMTPEETAQLQTKKMTLHLDLNDQQQAEVRKLLLAEAKSRKTKMEALKVRKEEADAEKPSKEDRFKMQNEYLDHQIEMKKKMKSILNADQYDKFEKMQGKRRAMSAHHAKRKQYEN